MATLDPRDGDGTKSKDLVEYEAELADTMQLSAKLGMKKQFAFIQQCNNIDKIGLNPKTGRHEMTDLDVKCLKLMYKQLMLQKLMQEIQFTSTLMAEGALSSEL